jgi:hypothetical protein
MVAERVADRPALLGRHLPVGDVDILEVQVKLRGVEAVTADHLRRPLEVVRKVPREDPVCIIVLFLPVAAQVQPLCGPVSSSAGRPACG